MLLNAQGMPIVAKPAKVTLVTPAGTPVASAVTPTPHRVALLGKRITILVAANPKLPGSKAAARFELYRNGMSVAEFLAVGGTTSDIRWNVRHNFIKLA